MNEADLNGDGRMDVEEAAKFLALDGKLHIDEVSRAKRHLGNSPTWFANMDVNGNGFIDPLELTSDYYEK